MTPDGTRSSSSLPEHDTKLMFLMKEVRVQVVEYYWLDDCRLWEFSHPEFEPAPIIPTSSRTVKSIGVL